MLIFSLLFLLSVRSFCSDAIGSLSWCQSINVPVRCGSQGGMRSCLCMKNCSVFERSCVNASVSAPRKGPYMWGAIYNCLYAKYTADLSKYKSCSNGRDTICIENTGIIYVPRGMENNASHIMCKFSFVGICETTRIARTCCN